MRLRYKSSLKRRQDYSGKPPSSTDKPLSRHPALPVSTHVREMVSLQPFGFLVREAFPGGAAHFDSVSKAFASLHNLDL